MVSVKPRVLRVVGLTFCDGYPETLHRLKQQVEQLRPEEEPYAVVLRRNPDNKYDPNAVEVHVPALGQQVGHLSREDAAVVAPVLDAPSEWAVHATVHTVRVNPDNPENPGLDVALTRVRKEGLL